MKLWEINNVVKKHNIGEVNKLLKTGWVILTIEEGKETTFMLGKKK